MPPAFILSQDQTLRCRKADLTIQVLLLHWPPRTEGRGGVSGPGFEKARLPHVALRCSVSKEASARKRACRIIWHAKAGLQARNANILEKKTEKGSGEPPGSPHKTIYRIERRRRIRSSRGGWVANSVPKLGKLIYIEAKALPPNSWTSLRVIPFSQF